MSPRPSRLGACSVLLMWLACQGCDASAADADMPAARVVYQQKCAVCHGATGVGDGPGAASLDPKPRSFSDAAWQSSRGDEQLRKAIVDGGAGVGKSPLMPPNPDLAGKPRVVAGLVKLVRGFKK